MRKLVIFLFIISIILSLVGCKKTIDQQASSEEPTPLIQFNKTDRSIYSPAPILSKKLNSITVEDDGRIAVFENEGNLFIYYPESNRIVNLNLKGEAPLLSYNGKILVFRREAKLYVTNLDYINPKHIGTTHYWASDSGIHTGRLDVSSDGTRIVFERNSGIYLVDIKKGAPEERKIVDGFNPSISKDGKKVVYHTGYRWDGEDIYKQVWLIDLADKTRKLISKNDAEYHTLGATFFQNDRLILFGSHIGSFIYDIKKDETKSYPYIHNVSDSGVIVFTEWDGPIFVGNLQNHTANRFYLVKGTYRGEFFICNKGRRIIYTGIENGIVQENFLNSKLSLWVVDL